MTKRLKLSENMPNSGLCGEHMNTKENNMNDSVKALSVAKQVSLVIDLMEGGLTVNKAVHTVAVTYALDEEATMIVIEALSPTRLKNVNK